MVRTMTLPRRVDIADLLTAAENASPACAVDAAASVLREVLEIESAEFLIADAAGNALIDHLDATQRFDLNDTVPGRAWREQVTVVDRSAGRAYVPVTVRGDALGVMSASLPADEVQAPAPEGEDGLSPAFTRELDAVAHALGYILVANQRHTDAYETAMRSVTFTLPREIQRRLLPGAFVCEGGAFTLAGWLEPSASAGGDTFDYIASADRLTLSLTDAVGHDLTAALLATLAVNALRHARRDGGGIVEQARAAHRAMTERDGDFEYVTGILLEIDLDRSTDAEDARGHERTAQARVVNAGHPGGLLLRDGRVEKVIPPDSAPFGLGDGTYAGQTFELRSGDRLLLMTDGMLDRSAAAFDLPRFLQETVHDHPRNVAQNLSTAFLEVVGSTIQDDAALLLLDWHGGSTDRTTERGSDAEG